MIDNFHTFKRYLMADLYRQTGGNTKFLNFVKNLLFGIGFKYCFYLRLCNYLYNKSRIIFLYKPAYFLVKKFIVRHLSFKYGFSIPCETKIGPGLYLGHFGSIIVNKNAVIGKNCNLSPGVVIGQINRGKRRGVPTIGSNVYIGPGAKILGNIIVGNNVAIGANAVVIDDVPNNAVVVGIPGKVISFKGSDGYVNFTDW